MGEWLASFRLAAGALAFWAMLCRTDAQPAQTGLTTNAITLTSVVVFAAGLVQPLVEDNPGLREQMLQILESAPDLKCLGTFATGEQAVPTIIEKRPDVVLMDIKLPGMSGIQCVAQIKKAVPEIQIIMVTVYEDSERIFRAMKAGASGYLIKSNPPEQLIEAIRDAYAVGAPMSSPIARKVVQHFHLRRPSVRESDNSSPREQEVLDLLAMGFIY